MSAERPDAWEGVLGRGLDARVRDLHESPLSLDDVRGRAGAVRRGRRLATAGGILAAAAVLVPVAMVAGPTLQRGNDAPPIATASPSPTRADDPADLGPGLTYLERRTLVRPDGTTLELPARYAAAARLGDGLVGGRRVGANGWAIDVLDAEGRVETSVESQGPQLAADDAHTAVAYIAPGGTLGLVTVDGVRPMGATVGAEARPLAVTGDCVGSAESCRIYLGSPDDSVGAVVVDGTGRTEEVPLPDVAGVSDVTADGLVAATTSISDAGTCNEVYDTVTATTVARSCEYIGFRFSPDATLLTGTHSYLDGIGNAYTSILDAGTLEQVARYEPGAGFVADQTWIDDTAVAVLSYEGSGTWSLVRLSVDGSTEVITTADGDDMSPPFQLVPGS